MSPEFAYFLKVNVAFMLFYAFYRLFFYKDTFFKLRRSILLIFFVLALVYPLMNFQEWVKEQEPIAEVILLYSTMLPETLVDPEPVQTMDWLGVFQLLFSGVYWLIISLLLLRFFIQLGSIIWLVLKNKQTVIRDTKVYLLDKPSGPFSFFKLIFIHPQSHSEKELEEILTHEQTHVRQWHSVDVIISELICISCWMNPFAWLLKREVRHNLEYLADQTVLKSGYDSKSYQYHLLGLAHQKNQAATNLYNNFNLLHLKNRISMMNKKRSRAIGRTKYLIFIPLAGLLMLLSNIEAVARITKELTASLHVDQYTIVTVKGKVVDKNDQPIIGAAVVVKGSTTGTVTDLNGRFTLETSSGSSLSISMPGMCQEEVYVFASDINNLTVVLRSESERPVFTVVEEMPRFPGGDAELLKFINTNVKYPVSAQENGIQGRVICAFVVNEDGSVSDTEIVRGVDPALDKEALRVISLMPTWTPGKQRGKDVAVKYTVPITFRLSGGVDSPDKKADKEEIEAAELADPAGQVFKVVENMPQFPGGDEALMKFISKNIKYPAESQEKGLQGRVICSFVVEKDGSLSNFAVERGIDPLLDKEAVRVLQTSPKWTPGTHRGKAVRTKYTVPITFRLE